MNLHAFISDPRPPRPWWSTPLGVAIVLFALWHLVEAVGRLLWKTH